MDWGFLDMRPEYKETPLGVRWCLVLLLIIIYKEYGWIYIGIAWGWIWIIGIFDLITKYYKEK